MLLKTKLYMAICVNNKLDALF